MGATTWFYQTDYTEDPSLALRNLQDQVFRSGAFRTPRSGGPTEAEVARRLRDIERNFEREGQALLDAKQQLQALAESGSILYDVPAFTAETLTPEYLKQRYLDLVEKMRHQPVRQFRSIGGLRKLCGVDGTHSILDIRRISKGPAPFAASPMSESELQQRFGTIRPSAAEIEARIEQIAELLDRWTAAYVPAYERDTPVRFFFIGVTGD